MTFHPPCFLHNHFHGTLLGLAVGITVEFLAPGTFPPVTGMVGGGTLGLRAGD